MRRLLFFMFSFFVGSTIFAQIELKHPGFEVVWPIYHHFDHRGTVNCDVDTIGYVQAKTSNAETKILYSNGTYSSRASQMFVASSAWPITIHGFRWFGYSYDPSGMTSPIINVDCHLYAASSDSLPTGSPLASVSMSIDNNPANALREAVFTTPVVVTGNYVLVVENLNTDWLFISSNDEDNNNGAGEGLSASYYEPAGEWRKNLNLWALGDFDFIFEPFASYSMDAKFNNPGMGCVGIPVTFSNTSSGPLESPFYNQDVFMGDPVSYHWEYGDGNTSAFLKNGENTFAAPGTYNVTLVDTIYSWTGYCTDNVTESIDIFAIPGAPNSTPPAPVCEYTAAMDLTASGSGGTFTWYSDSALSSSIGTGSPFASGINLADTVYVTETLNGCESPGTQVILAFLPNAIPMFTANNLGGMQTEFQGAPVATDYAWDFGDGTGSSTMQTPTYTFPGAGPYNVCLDVTYSNGCTNQYCENVTFVGVNEELFEGVAVYPNPVNTTIYLDATPQIYGAAFAITDEQGRLLMHSTIEGLSNRIDLSNLASGYYYLTIYAKSGYKSYGISKL